MLKYRPEIDGLRAIAVLAVIIFHADFFVDNWKIFQGGFIGVDVFFVISGFLITSIIRKDITAGKFNIVNFYKRRIRRLTPALFAVILACLPFAWWLMLPKPMLEFSHSILSTLGFSSNILFWLEDNYWAEDSALKPLLHTWSLSVEEQFYLFYPVFLIVIARLPQHWMKRSISFLLLSSFFFSVFYSPVYPQMTFYLLPARCWELMAGGLISFYRPKSLLLSPRLQSALLWISLFALIVCFFFFSEDTIHPSWLTVIPVAATSLLILFGENDGTVKRLLSNAILVKVGLFSYSLYLWHYPIFAFAKIHSVNLSYQFQLSLIVLTFALSFLSYHFIEKVGRSTERVSAKFLYSSLSLCFVFFLCFSLFSLTSQGTLNRFSNGQLKFLKLSREKGGDFSQYVKRGYNENVSNKPYQFNGKPRVLLIGDSFSQDFYNMLKEAEIAHSLDLIAFLVPTRCKNVPASTQKLNELIKERDQSMCKSSKHVGDKELNDRIENADGVVLASFWDFDTTPYIGDLVKEIQSLGVSNILIVGKKQFPTISTRELMRLSLQEVLKKKRTTNSEFLAPNITIKQQFPDIFLDLVDLVCSATEGCPIATPGGFLISYDGEHLTQEGARFLGETTKKSEVFSNFLKNLKSRSQN